MRLLTLQNDANTRTRHTVARWRRATPAARAAHSPSCHSPAAPRLLPATVAATTTSPPWAGPTPGALLSAVHQCAYTFPFLGHLFSIRSLVSACTITRWPVWFARVDHRRTNGGDAAFRRYPVSDHYHHARWTPYTGLPWQQTSSV